MYKVLIVEDEADIRNLIDETMKKRGYETKCEITLDGKEIKLLAKEFKLLAYFLKNPDKVVTKKQLYRQVWDDEYYFDDNTITVTISRLRSKIENKDRKYIHTIRGLGYKFKVDVRIV